MDPTELERFDQELNIIAENSKRSGGFGYSFHQGRFADERQVWLAQYLGTQPRKSVEGTGHVIRI